jgi:lipid-A-disaccharide synthase
MGITDEKRIVLLAGEASGDRHGAKLVEAIGRILPNARFSGVGGEAMRSAGVSIAVDMAELSVVGITEVFQKLPRIRSGFSTVKKLLRDFRPHLLIPIDFPDFNLKAAGLAKKRGIPVFYYISPQIWAWRKNRIHTLKRFVDHIAVILPFEARFYKKHGVPATFVGHPLLDDPLPPKAHCLKNRRPPFVVGLLPGSREGEVTRLFPVMAAAAGFIARRAGVRFLVSHAPSLQREMLEALVDTHAGDIEVKIVSGGARRVLEKADAVIAASGTVTLEAALYGVPMVVIYKVSPVSYHIGKAMIRSPHISLVNLVAGKELVAERIQEQATPAAVSEIICGFFINKDRTDNLKRELLRLRDVLGGPGAAEKTARIAAQMV